jgi:hypothetical protein
MIYTIQLDIELPNNATDDEIIERMRFEFNLIKQMQNNSLKDLDLKVIDGTLFVYQKEFTTWKGR